MRIGGIIVLRADGAPRVDSGLDSARSRATGVEDAARSFAVSSKGRPPSPTPTERLQAWAVRALVRFLRILPPGATASLGSHTGALYGRLSTHRFGVARENLSRALGPGVPPARIDEIARGVFRHFGRAAFEMLTMDRFGPSDIDSRFRYEGLEHVREAYARGRGMFLFSAHYGNWELVALLQGYMGMPLALVTRPLDNPLLEEDFRRRREISGNHVIGKRSAVRHALKAVSEGRGVAIVIDQNVRSGARLFVDFFGRPAATTPTLSLLALKTGAPIIPVFSFPESGGGYRIVYGPEVKIEVSGDRNADVRALTEECTRIIESQVRSRPELWLWMHERWKSRPGKDEAAG